MTLKDMIPPEMEPVVALALVGVVVGLFWLFGWAVEKYANMLGRRQAEHDRQEREKAEERKRQGVIGMYGVDE